MPRPPPISLLTITAIITQLLRPAAACCKRQFIDRYNLTGTALPTAWHNLTVNEARRQHVMAAMGFVPGLLFDDPRALRLEFGVRNGDMISYTSATRPASWGRDAVVASSLPWDGFDSFKGLPKSTLNAAKLGWGAGKYSVKGALPKVPSHVRLHVGWFNETLPPFLDGLGRGPVAFAHLDADIYTSTISVLDALAARCRLRLGTVLSFDEIFGPKGIENEEFRALNEAAATHGFAWRFITYLNHPKTLFGRAAVQVTGLGPRCAGVARAEDGGGGGGGAARGGGRRGKKRGGS